MVLQPISSLNKTMSSIRQFNCFPFSLSDLDSPYTDFTSELNGSTGTWGTGLVQGLPKTWQFITSDLDSVCWFGGLQCSCTYTEAAVKANM